jgi:hypothetical protein
VSRALLAALALVVALAALLVWRGAIGGERGAGSQPRPGSSSPSVRLLPDAPQSVGEPSEPELGRDWDRAPDAPVPDPASLSADQRRALLRLDATAAGTAESCTAGDVVLFLQGFDVALGHRFSHLVVANTSDEPCTVQGYPGIGGYGEWGSTFLWEAEQRAPAGSQAPGGDGQPLLTLQPGASAAAGLEWTGGLAGAQSEALRAFAVQLARDQDPALLVPPGDDPFAGARADGDPSFAEAREQLENPDIGMLSTVRVGPWKPGG